VMAFVAASEGQPNEGSKNEPRMLTGVSVPPLGVDRPSPADYKTYAKGGPGQPRYSQGFEVELLDAEDAGASSAPLGGITYEDPQAPTPAGSPTQLIRIKSDRLRYRVRFRYRLDDLINALYSTPDKHVVLSKHYTLDTPVFDDISIKFLTDRVIVKSEELI